MADIAHSGHGGAVPVHEAAHGHEQPSDLLYVKVALVLLAVTIAEVAVYYIQWMHDHNFIVPVLLIMSVIKFAIVVGFFMHLKFDDRRLLLIFLGGLGTALATVLALYVLFTFHTIQYVFGGFIK